ncbi:MAG: hypothetical protein SD837_07480 [Candidatus Electrothrix scaldis]|nr:MAG: hypothetical protein SD837_07480 [Candidatus Electrothrix sp. GW3-3]
MGYRWGEDPVSPVYADGELVAFIRITSLDYPYIYDVSDEFTIDHAKECE